MDLLNISCTQESSVLAKGEMAFSYVVEEGPSEEVLECNEREREHGFEHGRTPKYIFIH